MSLAATLVSESPNGATYLEYKDTTTVTFVFRNDGTETWTNSGANAVKLGTTTPDNRASGFADNGSGGLNSGWADVSGYPKSRILMQESSVTPGNNGTFTATFRGSPEPSSRYREYFKLLKEGVAWFGPTVSMDMDMRPIATTCYGWGIAGMGPDGTGYRWGEAPNAPSNRTTDIPKIGNGTDVADGYYTSFDPAVAYRQVELMKGCGFNLILLEFEGHGHPSDMGAQAVIGAIRGNSEFSNMRYCFFVANPTEFDYLYSFANGDPFYAKWDNKPLLPTWGTSSTSDNRFVMPSMIADSGTGTWLWETRWPLTGDAPVKGSAGTIIPRYDDRKTGEMPWGRSPTHNYDKDFTGTLFDDQFDYVKSAWDAGTIRICFINAWNEYHERIGPIEPHEDISVDGPTIDRNSAVNSDTYVFDRAQGYINQLKGL